MRHVVRYTGARRHTRRGASSVLVIFMMIILAVLGALAFTASYANLRLSGKTGESYSGMYATDALGERTLARVDAELAYAELDARAYLRNNVFAMPAGGPLPADMQTAIHSAYSAVVREGGSMPVFSGALFKRVYYYLAWQRLSDAAAELGLDVEKALDFDTLFSASYNAALPDDALTVIINISMGDRPGARQLTARVGVICPSYEFTIENDTVNGQRDDAYNAARTDVREWRQWQVPFVYEDGFDFDSTIVEGSWGE